MQSDIARAWLEYGRSYARYPSLWDDSLVCAFGPLMAEGEKLRDYSGRTAGAVWSVGAGDVPKYVQESVRGVPFWAGQYDGTDDVASGSVIPIGTGDFTVVSWISTVDTAAIFHASRNAASIGDANDAGWQGYLSSGAYRFLVNDTAGNFFATTAAAVNDGAWHCVAGVRNGATVETWRNGVVASAAGTANAITSTRPLSLGNSATLVAGNYLSGPMCSTIVYRRILTASEHAILATHPLAAYETVRPKYWMFPTATTHLWPWQIRRSRRMRGHR